MQIKWEVLEQRGRDTLSKEVKCSLLSGSLKHSAMGILRRVIRKSFWTETVLEEGKDFNMRKTGACIPRQGHLKGDKRQVLCITEFGTQLGKELC